MTRRVCTIWWRTRLSVHATTRYREIWVQHAEPKKLLYVSKTTNAEATHKQHSCQSTHHLQQQQPTTAATTITVQLRFMLCPLLRRWFMSVSLCTVWSKHWFTRRTLGRQPDVHFSTTLRHCACAQHVNWECAALCACMSLVCIGVCLWFQLLWLLYL